LSTPTATQTHPTLPAEGGAKSGPPAGFGSEDRAPTEPEHE